MEADTTFLSTGLDGGLSPHSRGRLDGAMLYIKG